MLRNIISNVVGSGVGSSSSSTSNAYVYIVFGQSNTGSGTASELTAPYVGAQNAWIHSMYGNAPGVRTWQRIIPGTNSNNETERPANAGFFGPEVVMGKTLSDLKPNKVFFIKECVIGTTLLGEGGTGDWKIGGPGTLYDTLLTNLTTGLAGIVAMGLVPVIKGVLWHQGEAERIQAGSLTGPQQQAAYQLESYRLIKQLTDDINELGYDTAATRFIWGRIHNNYLDFDPVYLAATRAAQVAVAANFRTDSLGYSYRVKDVTYLDTDAYGQQSPDPTHFNTTGALQFGTDAGSYFAPFVDEIVTYPIVTTGFDSDAITLLNATAVRRQSTADAVNTFVVGAKAQGIWTKLASLWLNCSGTRYGNKFNAVNPVNTDPGLRLTFNRMTTQYDAGFVGDTSGGYAETYQALNSLPQNSAGLFFYSGTAGKEAAYGNGATNSGSTSRFYLGPWFTSDSRYYVAIQGAEVQGAVLTDGSGSYIATRTSSSQIVTYVRGTKATLSSTSVATDSTTITIGARNIAGAKGSFSSRIWSVFGTLNASLNDTEAAALKTLMDNYVANRWS